MVPLYPKFWGARAPLPPVSDAYAKPVHLFMHTYIHTVHTWCHMCVTVYVCMHTYVHARMHVYICTYICDWILFQRSMHTFQIFVDNDTIDSMHV